MKFFLIVVIAGWVGWWVMVGTLFALERVAKLFGRKPRRHLDLPRHR